MMTQSEVWQVYLVRCIDDSIYAGITTDLNRRLKQHNGELPGGARYTRGRQPITLMWSEICGSRSDALRREAALRRLSRRQKWALIASGEGARKE